MSTEQRQHPDLFTGEEALAYLHQQPSQERTLETLRKKRGLQGVEVCGQMLYHRIHLDALVNRLFGITVPLEQQPIEVRRQAARPVFTYFIRGEMSGGVKIGKARDVAARITNLQVGSFEPLELIGILHGDREEELHSQFSAFRQAGEWFKGDQAILDFIKINRIDFPN